jgi:hypothetical protein
VARAKNSVTLRIRGQVPENQALALRETIVQDEFIGPAGAEPDFPQIQRSIHSNALECSDWRGLHNSHSGLEVQRLLGLELLLFQIGLDLLQFL